jgi:hypothetical protein
MVKGFAEKQKSREETVIYTALLGFSQSIRIYP